MIYEIMSRNDVPTSQMHIYLKNKTGNDGGIYPEIFNDLALTESINGLYAFAIGCVLTDNFTDTTKFLKGYPSKEVATLGLIQYIKGVATTIQLNGKCVNPKYETLSEINQLGVAPSLLNLDGDLFYKHYDTNKYYSKEAADAAEDSFPYWVINIVKEIIDCVEIVTPSFTSFELPYYIQNISNDSIPILNKKGKPDDGNIIGKLPPSGTEAIIEISNGYGVLASSENAYIYLTDKVRPIKHMVELSEIDNSVGTLKLPDGEFDVVCKNNALICAGYGTNNHYYSDDKYTYNSGDIIHIERLFHNRGVLSNGMYVDLHSDYVSIKCDEDHTNDDAISEITDAIETVLPPMAFSDCKYLVIIPMSSEEIAQNAIIKILTKSPYKNAYIDVDRDSKVTIVVYGDNDSSNVIKVKKKILAVFGHG